MDSFTSIRKFTKIINSRQHSTQLHCTEFYGNLAINVRIKDRNASPPVRKVSLSASQFHETRVGLTTFFVIYVYTDFHENPTDGLVVHAL